MILIGVDSKATDSPCAPRAHLIVQKCFAHPLPVRLSDPLGGPHLDHVNVFPLSWPLQWHHRHASSRLFRFRNLRVFVFQHVCELRFVAHVEGWQLASDLLLRFPLY